MHAHQDLWRLRVKAFCVGLLLTVDHPSSQGERFEEVLSHEESDPPTNRRALNFKYKIHVRVRKWSAKKQGEKHL